MLRYGIGDFRHYSGYLLRTSILIVVFYINYLYLIDRFLFKKQFLLYFGINILFIGGAVILQDLLFSLILGPPVVRRPDRPGPPQEFRILGEYVIFILAIGMSVALKATVRWYKDSVNLETAKAAQLEADLKSLRSQLNPHFLFNTLNNIYSLIAIDTHKAQDSIHRLSNLLRYVLYENDAFVPIEKELEFTRNYIDLMRLRLRPDVKVNVLIKNENNHEVIATLLFISLIENAFKHGINNGSDSFIDIKILIDEEGVLCTVENSLNEDEENIEPKNSGIGLANLQKRLELIYPDHHELTAVKRADRFSVLLRISFEKPIE